MGAIVDLLLLPVMAPVWGFRFVLEQLRDEADAVMRDEGRAFAELIDLSMRRTTEHLSDEVYAEREAALFERLSTIREDRNAVLRAQSESDEDDWSLNVEDDDDEEGWLVDFDEGFDDEDDESSGVEEDQ